MAVYLASGLPGPQTIREAAWRTVRMTDKGARWIPGGKTIDASAARDPLNTGYLHTLRAGMVMGKVTATGLYAPSIIGLVTADYTSGATSLTVSAATAVELVRRQGASGTASITHAPTPTGTVVSLGTLTYSAVNTSTGVITITDIGANVETGAIIGPTDGSETPLCLIDDGEGIRVTDIDGADVDQEFPHPLIGGYVDTTKIINYPAAANTTLIAWLKGKLNFASNYGFTFSDAF